MRYLVSIKLCGWDETNGSRFRAMAPFDSRPDAGGSSKQSDSSAFVRSDDQHICPAAYLRGQVFEHLSASIGREQCQAVISNAAVSSNDFGRRAELASDRGLRPAIAKRIIGPQFGVLYPGRQEVHCSARMAILYIGVGIGPRQSLSLEFSVGHSRFRCGPPPRANANTGVLH